MRQYSNLTNGLTHFRPLSPESVAPQGISSRLQGQDAKSLQRKTFSCSPPTSGAECDFVKLEPAENSPRVRRLSRRGLGVARRTANGILDLPGARSESSGGASTVSFAGSTESDLAVPLAPLREGPVPACFPRTPLRPQSFGADMKPGFSRGRLYLAQRSPYSSWRRHQTPVSLRPLGARSSHWYMPQTPSSPRP